jgi:dihydroxyacetone kinase-like protein
MNIITVSTLKKMILEAGRQIEENEQHLCALDAAIGDGDHGISMTRGFRAVKAKIEHAEYADLGSLLSESGKVMMKDIGGTCGPLFATFFLKMVPIASGKTEIGLPEWASMLEQGLSGVKTLGRANVGDKTMIDALEPAVEFMKDCSRLNYTLQDAASGAAATAMEGARQTIALVARMGRGRYQGDGSSGHQDAGATSMALIFKGFYKALQSS